MGVVSRIAERAFGWNHYVPVLRWKRGEYRALKAIANDVRPWITPLIELVPVDEHKQDDRLKWLAETCAGETLFLDLGLLPQGLRLHGEGPWRFVSRFCDKTGIKAVPVLDPLASTQQRQAVMAAAEHLGNSLCIRAPRSIAGLDTLPLRVANVLSDIGTRVKDINLIVDLGPIGSRPPNPRLVYGELRDVGSWRTFSLVGGAFPENLTAYPVGEHDLPREDWLYWRETVFGKASGSRIPTSSVDRQNRPLIYT